MNRKQRTRAHPRQYSRKTHRQQIPTVSTGNTASPSDSNAVSRANVYVHFYLSLQSVLALNHSHCDHAEFTGINVPDTHIACGPNACMHDICLTCRGCAFELSFGVRIAAADHSRNLITSITTPTPASQLRSTSDNKQVLLHRDVIALAALLARYADNDARCSRSSWF